jgi:hypothetical protein
MKTKESQKIDELERRINFLENQWVRSTVKEKLAKLAGVAPGRFVQVKSPFQAREITAELDPDNTQLIFVRSEKDADKPPQAGGIKKDGNPAYLQLYKDAAELKPMNQHAYMAYLPTVEFGPGMTSATEIRTAWPDLDQRRKTALVMSLYPRTQKNPQLAATVVKMLDAAIVGNSVAEGVYPVQPVAPVRPKPNTQQQPKQTVYVPDNKKPTPAAVIHIKEQQNPRIDLTPNFPNYSKLVGEFVGAQNNKLLFQIVAAELKPGVKPTEKIAKAMAARRPIGMAPNYVKNREVMPEANDQYRPPGISASQARSLMTQLRGQQPFVWKRPNQISGSHAESELLALGFKKSKYNTWGGTQAMWDRLAGIPESADYIEEKISR